MKIRNTFVMFDYLADLFPPSSPAACPGCGGKPYVFGLPREDASTEVLACTQCGLLFHYPCFVCRKAEAKPVGRDKEGFIFVCESCGNQYHKSPGWLERPPLYQEKLLAHQRRGKSKSELIEEALR